MSDHIIDVTRDFASHPFGRYPSDGDHSGEVFRETVLVPAMHRYDHVTVDLSGSNYYGSPFLEEAFGGLVRTEHFTEAEVERKLKILHNKLPSVVIEVQEYIRTPSPGHGEVEPMRQSA